MNEDRTAIAHIELVTHRYRAVVALDNVSLEIPAGKMVGIIGPDGAGKSTLLGIIAGARRIQSGQVNVFGGDLKDAEHRRLICPRIAYMPQGLGRNLYPDLTVQENIEFFARLFEQAKEAREKRITELLDSTGLSAFRDRPDKNLSGGMRQKLGLCCALIHDPDLLILDEPTTGVDPLSRRQFWDLIGRMRGRHPGMSVLVATAYMEEAEHFDRLIAMNDGRILAADSPDRLKMETGTKTIEETFIALLPPEQRAGHRAFRVPPRAFHDKQPVIMARELTRRFGNFVAVNRVNFTIERGEIFGFVGSNGCGKTTTMKMLTGLLEPSAGAALLFGQPLDPADMQSRKRVGYMSQSFSLYSELTVRQNLDLHARLFHLPTGKAKQRIERLVEQFGLHPYLDQETAALPLGIRQRLSLAVAVVHEPEMLILDEPTSGVDPLARDQFWELLIDLSRDQGVTIFVSTHFMNEAERCDRVALMHAGRVLAMDTPSALQKSCDADSLEEAFIAYLEREREENLSSAANMAIEPISPPGIAPVSRFSGRRLLAYAIRETLELIRDPIRLGFALGGSALLMLIFGFGISTDVDNLSFAVLDHDHTPESRAYISEFTGSRYFIEKRPVSDYDEVERRLKNGDVKAIIEIPPNFGRDIKSGYPTVTAAWIDGAMPFRAETIRGYIQGTHTQFVTELEAVGQTKAAPPPAAFVQTRFRYNQDFDSIYAMVPSSISLLLALIPAILMALAVVREKELGSITNLYVTPVTRIEFLIGKQLPYIALAMVNFTLMFLMALFLFRVPLKGSFPTLLLGAMLYVTTTTAYGMVISAFARTQIAALFGTAILTVLPATQFAGLMTPVSSLSGIAAIMGRVFPMSYFVPISMGAFTKGLGFSDLDRYLLDLALFIPVFVLLNFLLLRKQQS